MANTIHFKITAPFIHRFHVTYKFYHSIDIFNTYLIAYMLILLLDLAWIFAFVSVSERKDHFMQSISFLIQVAMAIAIECLLVRKLVFATCLIEQIASFKVSAHS